jgi:CubicO group peptidase (beta-lactamase class C family)
MLRRWTFLGLLSSLMACAGREEGLHPAGEAPAGGCMVKTWGPVDLALAAKFQAALEAARAEQQVPGMVMAVAYRDSRRFWISADGFSNLTTQTPWLPTDESRIGSVTKTFTTAIIMQLSEQGILSLDDAIEKWVPRWYSGPTLKHLLGHTSGIVSYNYVGSFDDSRPWTPDELVQWAYDNEPNLRFTPGSQWEYSNRHGRRSGHGSELRGRAAKAFVRTPAPRHATGPFRRR